MEFYVQTAGRSENDPPIFSMIPNLAKLETTVDRRPIAQDLIPDFHFPEPPLLMGLALDPGFRVVETSRATLDSSSGSYVQLAPYYGRDPLADAASRLTALRNLGPDWDQDGAAPPNTTALFNASIVLEALRMVGPVPQRLNPSVEEGVVISFWSADRYADIECFNSGEIIAVEAKDGHPPRAWEVALDQLLETVAAIDEFLRD